MDMLESFLLSTHHRLGAESPGSLLSRWLIVDIVTKVVETWEMTCSYRCVGSCGSTHITIETRGNKGTIEFYSYWMGDNGKKELKMPIRVIYNDFPHTWMVQYKRDTKCSHRPLFGAVNISIIRYHRPLHHVLPCTAQEEKYICAMTPDEPQLDGIMYLNMAYNLTSEDQSENVLLAQLKGTPLECKIAVSC